MPKYYEPGTKFLAELKREFERMSTNNMTPLEYIRWKLKVSKKEHELYIQYLGDDDVICPSLKLFIDQWERGEQEYKKRGYIKT